MRNRLVGFCVALAMVMAAGLGLASGVVEGKVVIGVAQPNVEHPYRVAGVRAAEAWATGRPDVELIVVDGRRDSARQLAAVEDLLVRGVDVLVLSPNESNALVPIAYEAQRAGVPLVLFDRILDVPEDMYAAFVGSDNVEMGRVAARFIIERLNGQGTVVQLEGTPGASATVDRKTGFEEVIANSEVRLLASYVGHYRRHEAAMAVEDAVTAFGCPDAVYAHNDEMALGAWQILDENGCSNVVIVGMDGGEEGREGVRSGKLTGSVYYHHMFPEALEIAMAVLAGESVPKRVMLPTPVITLENLHEFE